jgi:hypothetical protein
LDELITQSSESVLDSLCTGACKVCCYQTVEEYNARTDAQLRNRSLTLASFGFCILLCAHTYFAWLNRTLPIPEYFYAAVLIPFAGAAIRNVGELISRAKDDKKK